MKHLLLCAGLAACLGGCSSHESKVLGQIAQGPAVSVAAVPRSAPGSSVVLQGVMTAKCPSAGCWFLLHDATGTIKVDTKNAGFVVVDVPVNASMTVAGLVTTNDNERLIDATGVRY
jgi:uncharacterized protein YdeI (BOF family)